MNQGSNPITKGKTEQGELIKYEVKKYLRYWVWFALSIFIALTLAFLYLRYTPRFFTSYAKIQILNKSKGIELPSSAFIFNRSTINLENEIEILKSLRISERVVNNLDLTMIFYEVGNIRTTEINQFPFYLVKTIPNEDIFKGQSYKIVVADDGFEVYKGSSEQPLLFPNFSSYKKKHDLPFELQASSLASIKENKGRTFILKFTPLTSAAQRIKSGIGVSILGKSSDLLTLSYTSENTTKSETILNELIDVFNQDGIKDRQEISERTIDFIDERFALLAGELDAIEGDKRDYKQDNNFVSLEADAALGLSQRTASENEVFNIESQILISNMIEESLDFKDSNADLLPANIGIEDVSVNELISNYNSLIFDRDEFMTSGGGGTNNPMVQSLNDKLKEVAGNIKSSIDTYQIQLEATKKQMEARNRMFSGQVAALPAKEKILRSIERQQSIKETLYLYLLQKKEEAAINLAITEPSIKVVEYALSNYMPISPNSKNIYMMALLGGLLLPFGVIYIIMLLDTKIKGKRDIELRVQNVPILAELPKITGDKLVFSDPTDRTVQAEAFRILSSNVNFILPKDATGKGKVIFVTSTIKGEGKTYAGINLSLALSSINKKVLLIGADLRNPQIHHYTIPERDKNSPGLSNYLHDENFNWKNTLIKGFALHPDHDTLLSGNIPPNPAHLLTNGRFETLLNEAKELYDYIIVDTAPTILVTDTFLISQFADATLYLVRAEVTEKSLLDFSKNLFESGRLKNMAYVVNSVGASKAYGYTYNYGYNYGYGNN